MNSTLQDQLGLGRTDLEHRVMLLCKISFTVKMVEVFQAMKSYTECRLLGYEADHIYRLLTTD
jgi:hypothetical protein